jgi:hypothetical protein
MYSQRAAGKWEWLPQGLTLPEKERGGLLRVADLEIGKFQSPAACFGPLHARLSAEGSTLVEAFVRFATGTFQRRPHILRVVITTPGASYAVGIKMDSVHRRLQFGETRSSGAAPIGFKREISANKQLCGLLADYLIV